ncbi:Gfo/Idh/MocA family protein [Persicitalea jodogahamensis]|uniref:Oxidoreductase n=1 Tax=Persicitalea jodogahamensis TaxID=402147 RepID=A0A8J3DCF2_9BACT|nr:Gfo/Idh/MocA family oxidoreductase [Persicitalea jodogahamensis]GHB83388.1 oxidoreductase [Persicitalea jodogahamensis]
MIATNSPILVFGAGSIGERHLGILQKLGYTNLWVYRQRNLPLRTLDSAGLRIVTDLSSLDDIAFKAAIICTPTAQHMFQTLWCVRRGIPVLVEKPLAHSLENFQELKDALNEHQTYIQVAYMLRYHPFFQKLKKWIESNELGYFLSMQTYWGEYLPDWHPWEDYRDSYAARRELGGGVALTLSHDLDLANWLAGKQVVCWNTLKNYRSGLEINVESGADVSLRYQNGITAHCHLNFHERVPRRWYRFVFEEGSVEVDYLKASCSVLRPGQEPDTQVLENFDRNQLFENQIRDFLQTVNKGSFGESALRTLAESETILRICT